MTLLLERLLPGVALAATFVAAAALTFAQTVFNPLADTVERIVGGSVLLGVGWLVVRWTLQLLKEVQAIRASESEAAIAREQLLLESLGDAAKQVAALNAQLQKERELRISLERYGLADRRTHAEEE